MDWPVLRYCKILQVGMYVYESLCGHVQLFPDQVSSGNCET